MADDSIISSPNKLNSSIHRSRQHRKTKRLNTTFTKSIIESTCNEGNMPSNNIQETGEDLSGTLLIMYDSEEENVHDNIKNDPLNWPVEKTPFEIDSNYDPFAEQRLLVSADRFAAPSRSVTNFVATQGFKLFNNFLFQPLLQKNSSNDQKVGTFDITDSELLQVCEENERNATLKNSKKVDTDIDKSPTTPEARQKPKSIVDIILEDFCSSPASPELQQSSDDSNFHFKFANKPLRTYSRSRHENTIARKNISEQYLQTLNVSHCPIEDDLLSTDSSTDLSVQEDLTQIHNADVAEPLLDLNHSQNLCENLQNLSAYFMELSGEGGKNKNFDVSETKIKADSDKRQNILLSTNGANATIVERSSPTKVEKFTSKGDQISVEEFKGFASDEYAYVDMEPTQIKNCDTAIAQDDIKSLSDDDEWNDECDFLANFDMEEVLDTAYKVEKKDSVDEIHNVDLHTTKINAEQMVGFRTASNKGVTISAEAQERAMKILQDLQLLEVPTKSTCVGEQLMEDVKEKIIGEDLNQTVVISKSEQENSKIDAVTPPSNADSYLASSSKTKAIFKESLQCVEKVRRAPLLREHIYTANDKPSTSASARNELFPGFRTASSKTINISKEAQERATKILQQLPELAESPETKMTEAPIMYSARSTSRKTIQIYKEAKESDVLLLKDLTHVPDENNDVNAKECAENMQFSEWPVEDQMETNHKVETGIYEIDQSINLPGFSTASRKRIVISEEAKQKAASIFDNLPALPIDLPAKSACKNSANSSVTETFENVVFSEWPIFEDDVGLESALQQQTPECNKRKRDSMDTAHICTEPASPQHTKKLLCKSPQRFQRSPLAHIQSDVTRSSLSGLAVKTPPDYRCARGIISRKNLLSLNKRNKLNAKSLQQSNGELNRDESCAPQTPKKRNETLTSPVELPQSPPDTPTINLQEFFKSASMNTSTPQPSRREKVTSQIRTRARKRAEMEAVRVSTSPCTENDASLKRIEWDNESLNKSASSLNASKLSNSSFSNITKMERKPTPKQRIARLRMYGKPPNVSPIYMSSTNNCRTSGLKRLSHSANKDGKK
ncbi:breast cancer type 2 susceptibility protein homolog [Eurosta solidaginis]|uniref:breast cancer type 2 susceptibility protein homolog n=1 Tax=Eurosta solidaginis TaxID=178769 RepID=UPI003530AFE9